MAAMNAPVTNKNGLTTTQKVLIGSAIGTGGIAMAVVAAPMILPASTVVAIKATAGVVAAKATAAAVTIKGAAVTIAPVVKVVSPAIGVVKMSAPIKEYFYPTTEQKVQQLLRERASEKPFAQQLREAAGKK